MTRQDGGPLLQKGDNLKSPPTSDRKWMSVKEMGDLLGIRKTDRYWLVHKKVFKTETINGKMWVNVESFEKWYANQVKYQKITGEEPGLELKEWSLSPRDAAKLLGIPEARVYELIKEKSLEAVKVDYWLRIKKDSFTEWYQNQDHYRTTEDRERDQDLEDATLSFPQAALILGLTRHQFYPILKDKRYAHFFEFVEIAGRRRITKASFGRFLNGQDKYCIAKKSELAQNANNVFGMKCSLSGNTWSGSTWDGKNLADNAGSGNWLDGARFGVSVSEDDLRSWTSGLQ